jgi:hypothetical protein
VLNKFKPKFAGYADGSAGGDYGFGYGYGDGGRSEAPQGDGADRDGVRD